MRPGDLVVADIDGVVVVPEELTAAVLEDPETLCDTEDAVRAAITEGLSLEAADDEHGTF